MHIAHSFEQQQVPICWYNQAQEDMEVPKPLPLLCWRVHIRQILVASQQHSKGRMFFTMWTEICYILASVLAVNSPPPLPISYNEFLATDLHSTDMVASHGRTSPQWQRTTVTNSLLHFPFSTLNNVFEVSLCVCPWEWILTLQVQLV